MTRKIIPENILEILCVVFEIFEFEVSAISLYGHRTTIYGIHENFDLKYLKNYIWESLEIFTVVLTHQDLSILNIKTIDYIPIWELPD